MFVAIKRVKKMEKKKQIEKDVESLKNCISPFIVRYFNVFQKVDEVWVGSECVLSRLDCDGVLQLRLCSQNYSKW